jgi:hypothetical protein
MLPRSAFFAMFARYFAVSISLLLASLTAGAVGYHYLEGIPWMDAYLNAAMILTGMGPVNVLKTDSGKLFAIIYCLYSGVAFLSASAIMIAPVAHRFLHRFHLDLEETGKPGNSD